MAFHGGAADAESPAHGLAGEIFALVGAQQRQDGFTAHGRFLQLSSFLHYICCPEKGQPPGKTVYDAGRHILLSCPIEWVQTVEGVKDMAYEDGKLRSEVSHHVILEGREELAVSGVEEVESFDENTIVMVTNKGTLVVRGEDLHIEKLSLDGGDLRVEGMVESLTYEDEGRDRGGFLSRLLRG